MGNNLFGILPTELKAGLFDERVTVLETALRWDGAVVSLFLGRGKVCIPQTVKLTSDKRTPGSLELHIYNAQAAQANKPELVGMFEWALSLQEVTPLGGANELFRAVSHYVVWELAILR